MRINTNHSEPSGYKKGFWHGIVTAVLLLVVGRAGLWVAQRDAVQAVVEWLTQPMLTVMEMIGIVFILVIAWIALVEMPMRFRG